MTEHTRHKQEHETRAMDCWRRRVNGETQEQIAAALHISQPAVSQILRKLGERFAAQFVKEVLAHKTLQTARLEWIYAEALAQWARSCQAGEKVAVTTGRTAMTEAGPVSLPDTVTTTRFTQTGNPALLAVGLKALADIRDLWGLNAPQKQEISGAAGGPVRITEVVVELRERMQRLAEATDAEEAPGA